MNKNRPCNKGQYQVNHIASGISQKIDKRIFSSHRYNLCNLLLEKIYLKSHNVAMNNNMLISAIVPVYNTERKYLTECIQSILTQTYNNIELIIVDDGSNDECARLCDSFADTDPRVKVIHQKNLGVSAARNMGIKHISGQILTFVDSDDTLTKDAWRLSLDALIQYNADCAIFGWTDYCEQDTYIQKITDDITTIDSSTLQAEIASDNYKCGGGYPWNKLWRISSLTADNQSIPSFDPNLDMYEDKLWVLQAANNINTAVLLPDLLYNYRFVSSSITQTEEQRIPRLLKAYDAYKVILNYLMTVNDKAYVMAYNFCFEFTNNDIRYLSENKSLHREQIKASKKALRRLCKRIRPRTLYVPIYSRDFLIWLIYHYL